MTKIDYYSQSLNREIYIPKVLKDDIIDMFLNMSKHKFLMKRPQLEYYDDRVSLINKYSHDYLGKYYSQWDFEIFEEFATQPQKKQFKKNQTALEKILEDCAHRLDVIGLSDRNVGLDGVKFDETQYAFAKWLAKRKNNSELPHYSSFFAFHVEKLASVALLENKSISDWNSLGPAILRRVEEHPDITIYAHHYNGCKGREHTPKVYLDALRIFASAKTMDIIKSLIQNRRIAEKNKGRIQQENMNPYNIRETSGISEVLAEVSGMRPSKQRQIIGGGKAKNHQKPQPHSFPKKT